MVLPVVACMMNSVFLESVQPQQRVRSDLSALGTVLWCGPTSHRYFCTSFRPFSYSFNKNAQFNERNIFVKGIVKIIRTDGVIIFVANEIGHLPYMACIATYSRLWCSR